MIKTKNCIILIPLVSILFFASFAHSKDAAEPKLFIQSCLKDYILLVNSPGANKAEIKANDKAIIQLKQKCLDKTYIKNWKKIIKQTDSDPLLNSQDTLESWKTSVTVQSIDLKKSSAEVVLGSGEEKYCLTIGFKAVGKSTTITSSKICDKK